MVEIITNECKVCGGTWKQGDRPYHYPGCPNYYETGAVIPNQWERHYQPTVTPIENILYEKTTGGI